MNKFEMRKQTVYDFICSSIYVPMKRKELAIMLEVKGADRADFDRALDELVTEGKIVLTKKGRYLKSEVKDIVGKFISHRDGFGFIEVEGQTEDYFVGRDNTLNAMLGDTVRAVLIDGKPGRRQEAKVVEVLERGFTDVVGTYQDCTTYGFVVLDNQKIDKDVFIPAGRNNGAVEGHKVVVHITDYGNENKNPEGFVTEILGHKNDPGVDVLSIIRSYDLPVEFPEKVLNQAVTVAKEVTEADMAGREDLRDWLMVTIDGADTKDIDDAVSLYREGENFILGVHIADVTNYVQENSALDWEAQKRGTSVYLVDRVIPMLPHTLSNGICSLNPKVERLALSCIMTINPKGEIIDHKICESVIKSNYQMTYTDVAAIIERHDESTCAKYAELVEMFDDMYQVSKLLRARRHKRGAIDFDVPETKIELDETGSIVAIHPYDRNEATKLIEDFMLAANETVAEHFYWQQSPFVYRVHAKPDPEKISRLSAFMGQFGHTLKGSSLDVHPKELQRLLEGLEGRPEADMLSRLALRSMQQARYDVECDGHFGLAATYYCHFTSPIRRYPDLQIHRIIKDHLRGRFNEAKSEHYEEILSGVASASSRLERRAEEVEREVDKQKKVEYMGQFIGQSFEGIISSVTGWGFYVELPNTCEGLVHISTLLDDAYSFSEETYELCGATFNRHFKLGQKVTVVVDSVDDLARTIDFTLEEFSKHGQ